MGSQVHPLEVHVLPNRQKPLAYRIAHPTYDGSWSVTIYSGNKQIASAMAHFKGNVGVTKLEDRLWFMHLADAELKEKPKDGDSMAWAMSGVTGLLTNGSQVDTVLANWC